MTKRRLLIVAHAPSPNTRRLFDAVVEGARSDENQNLEVVALSPFDAGPEDVLAAGAIILGTTENLGYMSGALKDFSIEVTTRVWRRRRGSRIACTCVRVRTAREPGVAWRR